MNAAYILKESFSGFQRAKLSSAISVATIAVSLVLLGAFITVTLSAARVLERIRSRVEVEFFLSDALSKQASENLLRKIKDDPSVASATYISKEAAAKIFQKEFGEKIEEILGTNPLPQSIKASLKPDYATLDSLEQFVRDISDYEGVVEARYNKEFLVNLDSNARLLFSITAGLGVMISLASIALVSNTIRLAIYAKRDIIKTMKLVGATFGFIQLPFLIEGILQGLAGGAIAAALMFALMALLRNSYGDIYDALELPTLLLYGLLLALGCLLGFFGSFFSARRFINQ
jgi:cell division transport system permease protein